jgi:hypothetical protein
MSLALDRLREAMASEPPLTPFVGAGLSLAATEGAAYASWRGLLSHGIEICEQVVSPLPPGWAGRMKDQLNNADVFAYVAVANEIAPRLRASRGGREFSSWMERSVGALRATPEGERIIRAVRHLGRVIVTTNYDTLIEDLPPMWSPYTWADHDYSVALRAEHTVFHLRGFVGKPESIIFGSSDYERLSSAERANAVNKSLFASHRFIFIGCGDGLDDPDIVPLIDFVNNVMPEESNEHYILVRGGQLRQFTERPLSHLIIPVAYGRTLGELALFLEKLAAGEEIEVNQDPGFYEQRTIAKPRTALLDLAGPAQDKLEDVIEVLQRAVGIMDRVERRSVLPMGIDHWAYADERAAHEDMAAALIHPTAQLESCLDQMIVEFEEAENDIGLLTTPKFARYAARLAPIVEIVFELEELTRTLFARVTAAEDDIRARIDLCTDYRVPFESIRGAHENIGLAAQVAISLKVGLEGLDSPQVPNKEQVSRPQKLYVSSADQSATGLNEANRMRVGLQARAGLIGHIFISYVHQDSLEVDRLQRILEAADLRVWRDTDDLWPGEDWQAKIRHAITDDAFVFLACFSRKSLARKKTFQNQELNLAIEQMQLRPPEEPWLIPVRFDDCDIPDRNIGGGRSLTSIQCADLFGDRFDDGAKRLAEAIKRILGHQAGGF